jgi:putative transposase
MARNRRYFVENLSHHIIHRGNNRVAIFRESQDYERYYLVLERASSVCGVAVHAFAFMSNHVHLIVTPETEHAVPRLMQKMGARYVPYFNRRYARTGTLWEGRYKSFPIDTDEYFLTCIRYVELNPVRAGVVETPEQYQWSSHRTHAWGAKSSLIQVHAVMQTLGRDDAERQSKYREFCSEAVTLEQLRSVRDAVQSGKALGGRTFERKVDLETRHPTLIERHIWLTRRHTLHPTL